MSKPNTPTYKTWNWPEYNKALKRRGSRTIWFDLGMAWAARCRRASEGDNASTPTPLFRAASR